MTAIENVAIPCEFAGYEDAFDRARDNLAAVGLGHRLDHYPGQLSGGEQQRVALARAFVASPRVLLADEPTGNLDRATGETVIDLLFSLAEKIGTTLLLITHDSAIGARCAREVRIADGRASDGATAAAPSPPIWSTPTSRPMPGPSAPMAKRSSAPRTSHPPLSRLWPAGGQPFSSCASTPKRSPPRPRSARFGRRRWLPGRPRVGLERRAFAFNTLKIQDKFNNPFIPRC